MKNYIKKLLRENINFNIICNKMTINSYGEVLNYVENALQSVDDVTRYKIMQKIHVPLENLKKEEELIKYEIDTKGMSGDSIPDEADTYWHQIQNVFCKTVYK